MLGINYNKIADSSCSTTTLRARRDEWIRLGIFTRLEATARDGYDKMVGPDLEHLLIDGCIVKASCGGEAAGRCSPAGRGKQGPKRSLLTDGAGPLGGQSPGEPARFSAVAPHPGVSQSSRSRSGSRTTRDDHEPPEPSWRSSAVVA